MIAQKVNKHRFLLYFKPEKFVFPDLSIIVVETTQLLTKGAFRRNRTALGIY